MADAAAARREARRRRILENSHNRLQLISGKSSDECCTVSPARNPIPEQNYELSTTSESSSSKSTLNNGVLIVESETFDLLTPMHDIIAGNGDVVNENDSANVLSPVETEQTSTIWDKLISHKYDIVLLSLLIQLLYGLSFITLDSTYIFLPFAIYVITKLIFFPTKTNSKFANVIQLLNGLSPQTDRLQKVLSITQWSGVIFQDVCIYLFTTICIQSLYNTIIENFATL
ncbi:uncharacterized protein LOC131851403 [Achroia grisella]|uniref:uncharacterized protein LOC131851403 n=1 Tax=Achroia grisella TaxID=688607 RepID=UPI0027D2F929|nr:uncharacterized protein LOC131851403 [Achroia grisella]